MKKKIDLNTLKSLEILNHLAFIGNKIFSSKFLYQSKVKIAMKKEIFFWKNVLDQEKW